MEGRAPASSRDVRFIEGDPEGDGVGAARGLVAQGGGEVDRPGAAQRADHQVAGWVGQRWIWRRAGQVALVRAAVTATVV